MKKVLWIILLSCLMISCSKDMIKEDLPTISGLVCDESGVPVEGAIVSAYVTDINLFHGPANYNAIPTNKDGRFGLDLPNGTYYLVARKRTKGEAQGPLNQGDKNGEFSENPVIIKNEKKVKVEIVAKKIEGLMLFSPMNSVRNRIQIKGFIKDKTGKLIQGIYIIGYTDKEMTNKPDYISMPSNIKGEFNLLVDKPGKYYLAAKQVFKKPPVLGELMGVYEGTEDHGIEVKENKGLDNIEIIVSPVTQEQLTGKE